MMERPVAEGTSALRRYCGTLPPLLTRGAWTSKPTASPEAQARVVKAFHDTEISVIPDAECFEWSQNVKAARDLTDKQVRLG